MSLSLAVLYVHYVIIINELFYCYCSGGDEGGVYEIPPPPRVFPLRPPREEPPPPPKRIESSTGDISGNKVLDVSTVHDAPKMAPYWHYLALCIFIFGRQTMDILKI